jgi:hypothetical protein
VGGELVGFVVGHVGGGVGTMGLLEQRAERGRGGESGSGECEVRGCGSDGADETVVERVEAGGGGGGGGGGGVAASSPAILVLETHDLPSVLVVDEAPPEATHAACASERLWVVDEAEDVEADLDGQGGEEVDLEPWVDDGGEVR